MARNLETKYISLLGKLIAKYGVMSDLMEFDDHERELLRGAKTEYDFYHTHERVEAPIVEQKSRPSAPLGRPKLGLKSTS